MRRLWLSFLILICGVLCNAQNTTLTGTLEGPGGQGLTGTLWLSLSNPASVLASCSGGPALILPQTFYSVSVVGGILQGTPTIWGADCMAPIGGFPYNVKVTDPNGNTLMTDQWLILGSTYNVGSAISVAPPQSGLAYVGQWNDTITYSAGQLVTIVSAGVTSTYASLLNTNTNNSPPTSPTYWVYLGSSSGGGGGSPGGSNLQMQYNNSGAFGGSAATLNAAGSITIPYGQFFNMTGSSSIPNGSFGITSVPDEPYANVLGWTTSQTPHSFSDLMYQINNTYPFATTPNVSSFSYSDGVLTINTIGPSNIAPETCMIFLGFTGALAPLNNTESIGFNAITTGNRVGCYTVLDSGWSTDSFQIEESLVTTSGTDTSGIVNFAPDAMSLNLQDAFDSGSYVWGAEFGMRLEDGGFAWITEPNQHGFNYVGECALSGSCLWVDAYNGMILTESSTLDDGYGDYTTTQVASPTDTPTAAALTTGGSIAVNSTTFYGTVVNGRIWPDSIIPSSVAGLSGFGPTTSVTTASNCASLGTCSLTFTFHVMPTNAFEQFLYISTTEGEPNQCVLLTDANSVISGSSVTVTIKNASFATCPTLNYTNNTGAVNAATLNLTPATSAIEQDAPTINFGDGLGGVAEIVACSSCGGVSFYPAPEYESQPYDWSFYDEAGNPALNVDTLADQVTTKYNTLDDGVHGNAVFAGSVTSPELESTAMSCTSGDPYMKYNGTCGSGGSGTVYPGAGIANSTGSAWGISYTVGNSGTDIPQLSSGLLNNSVINWAAPNALGTGTANAGNFTNLQATGYVLSYGNISAVVPNTAISGTNYSSPDLVLQGSYYNGSSGQADSWTWQNVLGTGSNPTSTYTLMHSGSSGATSVSISAALTTTGLTDTACSTAGVWTSTTGGVFGCSNAPSISAANMSSFPTFNQNTSGTAANITASTNSTLTTLSALSLPYTQLSGYTGHAISVVRTCSTTNSGNAYSCTTSPSFTPAAGDEIQININAANTGSATLNVNSTSAYTIYKNGGTATLASGDLQSNHWISAILDSSNHWQLEGQLGQVNASEINGNTFPASAGFTSGGIAYFSSTSAVASSALLTHYGLVYGGGAGAAPVAMAACGANFPVVGSATAPACSTIGWLSSATQWGIAYMSSSTQMSTTAALTANALIKAGSSSAPSASSVLDNGTVVFTPEPTYMANGTQLNGTSATSITSTSLATTSIAFPATYATTAATYRGQCHVSWEQATGVATVQFGIHTSGAPTHMSLTSVSYVGTTAVPFGTGTTDITSATTTAATASLTPGTTATAYVTDIYVTLSAGAAANTITLYGLTSNGSDALLIEPGTFCTWLP